MQQRPVRSQVARIPSSGHQDERMDINPSPTPIYMDLNTPQGDECIPNRPILPFLSKLRPFRITKEMRLMLETTQQYLETNSRHEWTNISEIHSRDTYDRLCLIHFSRGGGALRSGGTISLWSRMYFGLVLNFFFTGFMLHSLQSTMVYDINTTRISTLTPLLGPIHPILGIDTTYMLFPASLRFLFGLCSDLFPIWGYRRKSYMFLGWLLTAVVLILAAFLNYGNFPLFLTIIACVGVTLADVAAEGLLVECAQRENLVNRGRLQAILVSIKFMGGAVAQLYLAVLKGSRKTEWSTGDTSHQGFVFSLAVLALIPTPFLLYVLNETPTVVLPSLLERCSGLWRLLQSKAMGCFLLFSFIYSFATHVGSGQTSSFMRQVLDVQTESIYIDKSLESSHYFENQLLLAAAILCFATTCMIFGHRIVSLYSWPQIAFWSTIAIGFLTSLERSSTIFDTVRNRWFTIVVGLLVQFPSSLRYLVSLVPIVELANDGYEATIYSLCMSVQLVAIPIGTAIFSILETPLRNAFLTSTLQEFKISLETSSEVQASVAQLYGYGPLLNYGAILGLLWLPYQKVDAQVWRAFGGSSGRIGFLIVALWWILLTILLVAGTLRIYPSWNCYEVFGGMGCSK